MADCSTICPNGTQILGTVVSVQVVVASMVKSGWIFPPRPLLGLSPSLNRSHREPDLPTVG